MNAIVDIDESAGGPATQDDRQPRGVHRRFPHQSSLDGVHCQGGVDLVRGTESRMFTESRVLVRFGMVQQKGTWQDMATGILVGGSPSGG